MGNMVTPNMVGKPGPDIEITAVTATNRRYLKVRKGVADESQPADFHRAVVRYGCHRVHPYCGGKGSQ
ncbi:hypothetical protein P3339_16625 [Microbulbifer sp. MLAF003]|uniref:hypothetical protein n=1 Tax=Microbulbifer sp. MLAF003 TaxID=3032582 RepID=UPI0024AD5B92|nr:hypothetical protein [Microbulbifer sp. MLAF003]WHI53554.1 hypothetical protein P3339_16625 [Microbulbifer sp. MLAF003]